MNKEMKKQRVGDYRRNSRLEQIQNWSEVAELANWSVNAMAKRCGVSVRMLQRHFSKKMGESPKAWITECRQNRAMKMVVEDGCSVKETAIVLGYQHGHHFSRQFKKHWGYAPKAAMTTPR